MCVGHCDLIWQQERSREKEAEAQLEAQREQFITVKRRKQKIKYFPQIIPEMTLLLWLFTLQRSLSCISFVQKSQTQVGKKMENHIKIHLLPNVNVN